MQNQHKFSLLVMTNFCRSALSIALIKHGGPRGLLKVMQPNYLSSHKHYSRVQEVLSLVKHRMQKRKKVKPSAEAVSYMMATLPPCVKKYASVYIKNGRQKEEFAWGLSCSAAYKHLICGLPEVMRSKARSVSILNRAVKLGKPPSLCSKRKGIKDVSLDPHELMAVRLR